MRKLDEIKSVDELTFVDYYNYKAMMTANKTRILGKSEFLYLLPLILGASSLGLVVISPAFLALSLPLLFFGVWGGVVAGKSIYVNYCRKCDNKEYVSEYKRLKKAKQLSRVNQMMKEFENTDKYKQSVLEYQTSKLQSKISYCETLEAGYDPKFVETLRSQLESNRGMLSKIKGQKRLEDDEKELDLM